MSKKFACLSVVTLALGAVWHAFDAAFRAARWFHCAAPPDSLLYYNMLLGWWRRGDSPLGYTLTPSPYFVDIALQLPIAVLAPDFERFAYVLAFMYALLIFAALAAVLATVCELGRALAFFIAGLVIVVFYTLAPFSLILHSFICNHTSEVFSTLFLLALLAVMFRPGAPRRWYAPALYVATLTACVASSPFFIATYCIPASAAAVSVVGTQHVTRRRLAWFAGLSTLGTLAGLVVLALIGRYLWPVRQDHYVVKTLWKAFKTFKHSLYSDPHLWYIALAVVAGAFASAALAVFGGLRRWPAPLRFALAYYPASVAACVLLPLKRGAYIGWYELRYFQLPWLLTVTFYVTVATWYARAVFSRIQWRPTLPRWSRWSVGALAVGGVALVATTSGPLTVNAPASTTSNTVGCFGDAERSAGLEDGIATVWMARYLNAARLGSTWRSRNVIVQLAQYLYPAINPAENNLVWFDGTYRRGTAKLNFLVTHALSDDALAGWRALFGAPDRVLTCPSPIDVRPDGKATFEIWVWRRDEPQRKLVDMVTRDNLRSPFAPAVGASEMLIDVTWGMRTDVADGVLVAGRRVWRRQDNQAGSAVATTHPMFLPGGLYRLEIELSAVPAAASANPVADVLVQVERDERMQRFSISAGTRHAVFDVQVKNPGSTSGNATTIAVIPRAAESVELSGMKLTLIALDAIAPFEIFR